MERFYSVAELKDILKVSDVTLRRYIRDGKLESQKAGRKHRIPESSLMKFLSEQKNKGGGSDE